MTAPVARGAWSMRRRIAWTWQRNPAHVPEAPWSRRRARRERDITRRLTELPALIAGVARLAVRTGDERARQVADQLTLITPEGLGLLWYVPHARGGGQARARWYIAASADLAVSAALALLNDAYRLVTRASAALWRETRRMVAGLARAMRRDLSSAYGAVSPHPPTGAVSLSRDNSCSSEAADPEYWQRKEAVWRQRAAEELA